MTKQTEALKIAIEALGTLMMEKGSIYQQALQACKHALEQTVVMERDYNFMRDLAIGCEDAWNELHKQEPEAVVAVDNFGNISVGWNKKPQHNDKLYFHPAPQPAQGEIVVTKNDAGQIVMVSRQDSEGNILSVIAESENT